MKVVECTQGTIEWHLARAGVITASNFRLARERMADGKTLTKTADDHAFKLASERFIGNLMDDEMFETWAMKRGQKLEAEARIRHMSEIGIRVRPVGMVLSDDLAFGASADGWIGDDGGAEYKCLIGAKSLKDIYLHDDMSFYDDQVQGNLWLSNRKWWDFCVYCPDFAPRGLDFYRQRVERNENYIEQMVYELNDFNNVVNRYVEKLEERVARREGRVIDPVDAEAIARDIAEAATDPSYF
ncbi:YqaJ viral recombinase family protein [Paraburkholderia sediminicola]|uniref:lambda exonuclease family protein n=1 Tax=Paraburkholderia sediminicola TaxID=458836 RepID=UPI0038B79CF1